MKRIFQIFANCVFDFFGLIAMIFCTCLLAGGLGIVAGFSGAILDIMFSKGANNTFMLTSFFIVFFGWIGFIAHLSLKDISVADIKDRFFRKAIFA